ncbi:MAG: OmpA family protein, partial [Spirochaetaceae bacterium]
QVEDGRYSYQLLGEDEAGNRVTLTQENIRVDREKPGVSLSANRRAFSPNESGVRDTVSFETSLPDAVEPMEWTFSVLDADDRNVTSESGGAPVPEQITFAGTSEGDPLPEGSYRGHLEVVFVNGVVEEALSRPVTLDVTPPSVAVSLDLDQFSPEGDEDHRRLTIRQESSDAIHWRGRIIPKDEDESILSRTWEDELAEDFSWNGQTESGENATSGHYRYVLTARDRAGNSATVESEPFLLEREGPSLDVAIDPVPFNPAAEEEEELLFTVDASDRTGIEHWAVTIRDPEGNRFARIEGDGEPADAIAWDGRGDEGELPESLRDYAATVTVTNTVGNRSSTERTIPIGLRVDVDDAGNARLRVTGIRFAPFEAEFLDLDDPEVVENNRETLDTVAEYLAEFPDQDVRIEGHAVHIFFAEERARREQEEVLLPLSEDRALAIKDALVERGIAEERLSVEGFGGSEPVVPHDDMENRWRNRRVEFVLVN